MYFLSYSFLTLKYLVSISNLSAASIASHLAAITLLCFKIQDFPWEKGYFPWLFAKCYELSYQNQDTDWCNAQEEVIKGFVLLEAVTSRMAWDLREEKLSGSGGRKRIGD